MQRPLIRILLVQNNPEYALFLKELLKKQPEPSFQLYEASTVKEALEHLQSGTTDIILLELALRETSGLEIFEKIQAAAPQIPIVILTSLKDELTALQAVQKGAQDYLLKAEDEGKLLMRVIRCALERQRVKTELLNLSFIDDLTGLYNRRGFFALADQQIRLAKRSKKGFLLMIMDLDEFKKVNDIHGHAKGDEALRKTAELLRRCFRQTDILARLGGDEFAALGIEASSASGEMIYKRLTDLFSECNMEKSLPYHLKLSGGVAYFDPEKPVSFEALFEEADEKLYQQKRNRRVSA